MYRFLQRNNKKILAVFTAGLMIVFVVDMGFRRPIFGGGNNVVYGKAGGQPVRLADLLLAENQWKLLKDRVYLYEPQLAQTQQLPLVSIVRSMGDQVYQSLENHPDMFLLLQLDAKRLGVNVSPEQLNQRLAQDIFVFDGRKVVRVTEMADPDAKESTQAAIASFLLVQQAAERAATNIKISEPLRKRTLALDWQSIKLNVVDFSAEQFKDKVPAPTTQQLEQQFQKYANQDAEAGSTDPLGFGYRLPNRVKLQYLKLSHAELKNAARKRKWPTDYEMKVESYKEYSAHPENYRETKTDPLSSSPITLGNIAPLALQPSTAPTTKPFDAVSEQIMEQLLRPEVQKLQQQIVRAIQDRMNSDEKASSQPTTAATQAAGGYRDFTYLRQVADAIEKQFGVRPSIVAIDQFKTASELSQLAGIGPARTAPALADGGQTGGEPFSLYAISRAAPLRKNEQSGLLPLYKISPPLTDAIGDVYLFRLTEAQPAHVPEDWQVVKDQVTKDYYIAQGYEQARASAGKLLGATSKGSLKDAAASAGLKVETTGSFSNQPGMEIPNYSLPSAAAAPFIKAGFALLAEAAKTGEKHPASLVELPGAQKVAVIELAEVTPRWSPEFYDIYVGLVGDPLSMSLRQRLLADWFNYDALRQRLSFVSDRPERAERTQ